MAVAGQSYASGFALLQGCGGALAGDAQAASTRAATATRRAVEVVTPAGWSPDRSDG